MSDKNKFLDEFEQMIMPALIHLEDEAYSEVLAGRGHNSARWVRKRYFK
ncbi:hypothetical protein L1077_16430 [Pseudoalteromonas luteoviolacea]|nr:hypothetical protein [Pseudoalteromonas luteoviolacea]MCF6441025.1 hypothetical protein [Pseudoalteromonas luteoviolacea]